ncbi:hypothetical protein Sango_1176500 [Sesamum angolense]|uniref:Uncharacterized protein n=1 Tax=Sesamum angolense TaxID=2727404 RepID=A0AAE1WVX0_9LAMI|nr:hypothetical protein Sango_1176500 [Sesamum angolense]
MIHYFYKGLTEANRSLVDAASGGNSQQVKAYGICTSLGHPTDACHILHEESTKHVDAIGDFSVQQHKRYDPFSNTYNPRWRDHPNLRYGNRHHNFKKPPYQQPPLPPQTNPNPSIPLEDIVKTLALSTQQFQQDTHKFQQEIRSSIQNLESQISQRASSISCLESQGKLPPQTIISPKQNASAIVLRSGKELKSEVSTKRGHTQSRIENLVGMGTYSRAKQSIKRAMYDLGASINVMPLTIFKSLNVGSLKDTGIVIKLAHRSIVYLEGVLEDVLAQVNKLVFAAPFFVIDMRQDNSPNSTSILLGRPFLKIARTKFDVHTEFSTYDSQDNTNLVLEKSLTPTQMKLLEEFIVLDPSIEESILKLEALPPLHFNLAFIELPRSHTKLLPSILQAPTLELRELPKHLKYAFLGDNDTLPVIISSKLSALVEEKLIRVLQEFHIAIGWTIADNKGLSPSTSLKHLMPKKDTKPMFIRWIFLLQEFDLTIKDKKGAENLVVGHLNQLITKGDTPPVKDELSDERLLAVQGMTPWYADLPNLFKDSYLFCKVYENCQKTENLGSRDQMPLTPIKESSPMHLEIV